MRLKNVTGVTSAPFTGSRSSQLTGSINVPAAMKEDASWFIDTALASEIAYVGTYRTIFPPCAAGRHIALADTAYPVSSIY